MNNYKIKVNSKNESKEVQDLFESLGYEKGACSLGNYPAAIVTTQDWATGGYCSTRALGLDIPAHDNYTEITLPELRDMVVLNRNDKNDRNAVDPEYPYANLYLDSKNYLFVFHIPTQAWKESNLNHEQEVLARLKPIEKKMKEYLDQNRNYELILSSEKEEGFIEIPELAEFAVLNSFGEIDFYDGIGLEKNHFVPSAIIWQRPTQPEELPFIDDEPKYTDDEVKYMDDNGQGRLQSISDQYAEIEQVRQHSHYKKDVSNLEFVDVYRVLKLFDVTDPCLQHAIKKLLCSGQRGAKSSDQDVQEAIDSLVRFQQMRIEDSLD